MLFRSYLEKPPTFAQSFAEMFMGGDNDDAEQATDLLSTLSRARMAMLGQAVADARSLATGSTIQVRCLECPVSAAPAKSQPLTEFIVAWMTK